MYEHSGKLNAHACNRVIEDWGEVIWGMHIRRSDPRASGTVVKNACFLMLHWC